MRWSSVGRAGRWRLSRSRPANPADGSCRLFSRRRRLDAERVNPIPHQIAQCGIHRALTLNAIEAGEGGAFDGEGEVAFAASVVAGVAKVAVALIVEVEAGRG